MYGCSITTVFNNLRGYANGRGGKHAKRIPAHELHKGEAEEMQQMAEQNAENACVMLEKCVVKLMGTVGKYTMSPGDGHVYIRTDGEEANRFANIPGDGINIMLKDIPDFIEELKGVCRCAKSFDMGNAMW